MTGIRNAGVVCATLLLFNLVAANQVFADGAEGHKGEGLHFFHPILTESPSPDTKARFDYFYRSADDENEHEFALELEYALHRALSVELEVPFAVVDHDDGDSESGIGNIEVGFKLANYSFAERNLLLGAGLEMALPTGDDEKGIGSDHLWEVEPFLFFGYKRSVYELVGFLAFGIPFNQEEGEEIETELKYDLSYLYHFTPRVGGVIELNGETVLSGEEDGHTVVNLSPGVLLQPTSHENFHVGLGASFPITEDESFNYGINASLFYHFQ